MGPRTERSQLLKSERRGVSPPVGHAQNGVTYRRVYAAPLALLLLTTGVGASDGAPDLSEYRTVETAAATRALPERRVAGPSGYLGVEVTPDRSGKLVISAVAGSSPAARAGVRAGDVLIRLDGEVVGGPEALHDRLRSRPTGAVVQLALTRDGKPLEVKATLGTLSRPMKPGSRRAVLGLEVGTPKDGPGVAVTRVVAGSPADKARVKVGETLLRLDGVPVTGQDHLQDLLAEKKPDDVATLTLYLAEKALDLKVPLGAEPVLPSRGSGWDTRGRNNAWRRPVYRLAVVCVEYPDVKHNPAIPASAWQEAFFSRKTYTKTSVTGQQVYGSLADYYHEQSYASLRVEGKVFDYVLAAKKRTDYAEGNRSALLTEAIEKLLARDGKNALDDYDGVCFIYAGGRVQTARGSLYWPHRATVSHNGKRYPYFICPEGGQRMGNISVFCHEFGHLLGLPDLYARPENPGSEGLSVWCAMSNQVGNGRPQHFCAWAKERLGWLKPTVIDPTVPQKLILAPVEDSPRECFKILLRPDGGEYFLLENRHKKGFDQSLPADGLLIWRVVGNRPALEESHGIEGPAGPRVFAQAVPYPSECNDSFTPYTTPSSRAQLGEGLPLYITQIRRLPDGRITFHIGYEYQ